MNLSFVPGSTACSTMSVSAGTSSGGGGTNPARYTHGHHPSVLRSHKWRTAVNSASYLLPHLRPDATVLDVGCGPGTITADLAALVPNGSVLGVDVEPNIVAAANASYSNSENLTFATADVMAGLPYADSSFDIVHAHQVLQHVACPDSALREMQRVCRRGGLVAARDADYAGMTWAPELAGLDSWAARYGELARANGGEPNAGRHMLRWARNAGFKDVTASASVWCFADDYSRAWWGGLWADRVTSSSLADQWRAAGVPEEDLEVMREAWLTWAADDAGWFSVVHGEVLCVA